MSNTTSPPLTSPPEATATPDDAAATTPATPPPHDKRPWPTEPSVMRFEIAYDGGPYHGWQIQSVPITVQGEIQRVLTQIFQTPTKVHGASRTDAGVHALGQVVSLPYPDPTSRPTPYALQRSINSMLRGKISVLRIEHIHRLDATGRPFHARHSARGKIYRYSIWPHRIPHPFRQNTVWRLRRGPTPDGWKRAQDAAQLLVGTHDFAGFRAADCESSTSVRTLYRADLILPATPDQPVVFEVHGTAFLKNMVRILTGTLVDVALGTLDPSIITTVLATGDRRLAGQTAPPHGLCLDTLFYPDFPWSQPRWSVGASHHTPLSSTSAAGP